jgi:hypothetical protein
MKWGPTVDLASNDILALYVSTSGDDSYEGTYDYPFRSIAKALAASCDANHTIKPTFIVLRGGTYILHDSIEISVARDALNPLTIMAYPNEAVSLTAAQAVAQHAWSNPTTTSISPSIPAASLLQLDVCSCLFTPCALISIRL